MTFEMEFRNGKVDGSGTDDVGVYTIAGVYSNDNLRVAFGKTYVRGTGNPSENLGHTVEYRGQRAANAGQGFRGTWYVHTTRYKGQGPFHLWPAMRMPAAPAFVAPVPSAPELPVAQVYEPVAVPTKTFDVAPNNECIVCMDRHIDACLVPCGHVALCTKCATSLMKKKKPCPICRADIKQIQVRSAAKDNIEVAIEVAAVSEEKDSVDV